VEFAVLVVSLDLIDLQPAQAPAAVRLFFHFLHLLAKIPLLADERWSNGRSSGESFRSGFLP
jgi:hypothetical protein